MASQVSHAIIGTAGHIDHGKTALIKALTGQDTDRLKEEKERGISIDLGFAYLTLPDGTRAGMVDVPGHERFIRNMLAGAHGIDLVLFAISADDGVMPQTEEHLDILHLLGAQRGIFVISKTDLVGQSRIAEVAEEIRLLAEDTNFRDAPITGVSSISGAGLCELRAEILRQLQGFQGRRATGIFRLPLDRAFIIKGHGKVVTGTAMGATVAVGQKLHVLPGGHEVRVRSIQVHNEPVEQAGLGQRVALNLSGTEKISLTRGNVLADDHLEVTTERFDAMLEIRPSAGRALKNNERVRVFLATAEVTARAIILDESGSIASKSRGLVQLVLRAPLVALGGDHFVIRDQTNVRTLGGGIVLNPLGRLVRKPIQVYRNSLALLAASSGAAAIEAFLAIQEAFALSAARLSQLLNWPTGEIESAVRDIHFVKLSLGDEEAYTTRAKWEELKGDALDLLARHHQTDPLSPGLQLEVLRSSLPYHVAPRAFRALLDRLGRETGIVREESVLRLGSHRIHLGGEEGKLGAQVEAALRKAEFHPLDLKQLAELLKLSASQVLKLRTVLSALERQNKVVKIATDLYFAPHALDSARIQLIDYLGKNPEITAAAYRDLLGFSRKFAIALLDYFDHTGVTTRVGDVRRLRTGA